MRRDDGARDATAPRRRSAFTRMWPGAAVTAHRVPASSQDPNGTASVAERRRAPAPPPEPMSPPFVTDRRAVEGAARRLRVWLVVATLVATVGAGSAQFAAESVARHAAEQSQRQLASTAAQIASTLQLALQHEQDLIISTSAFVAGNPTASYAAFDDWASSVQAFARYPELVGFGQAVIVENSELPAFEAHAKADPASPLAQTGTFQVVPAGVRPYYCLASAGSSRQSGPLLPAGFDYCSGRFGAAGLAARDEGHDAYVSIGVGSSTYLVVLAPVYLGGQTPASVSTRRASFLGWVGMEALPQVVLQQALAGHPNTAVTFTYGGTSAFQRGTAPAGAQTITTSFDNGWTVRTAAAVSAAGVLDDDAALALLCAGIALSAVLAVLIFVLATGRLRALTVVSEKSAELRHQALHDMLTGLPNRALIMDRFEQMISRNRRSGTSGAVLYLDLDGFKNVNDTLGHAVGDRLLQAVAARLTSSLRDTDTIGRMGGDEFVVLIDGATLLSAPELVAERALDVIRAQFEIDGVANPVAVTASIGIASGHHRSADDLLREADMALYRAKAVGKNGYEAFHPDKDTDLTRRYELEFDLRTALDSNQFRLVYQPIYSLDDLSPVGCEALLRWEHPTMGSVPPDEFIPLLESSGQIVEVGRWVLHVACKQTALWRSHGHELRICVNVSGRQLDRDSIVDDVTSALQASGLDPNALTIEITETALTRNIDTTASRLRQIKELGVQVAIDDFGTGYSSLAYLQRFPVDCLKIDRTFTNAITHPTDSDVLIQTLVQLGKSLGLTTLAEGVESTTQIDYLRGQHVDLVQGFLLAKPLEAGDLESHVLRLTRRTKDEPTAARPAGQRPARVAAQP
jgi:diguanylate cyclase (GGDEF)-like protein